VNSLPKTVTRQRRDCDLNPGPSAPESSTLTTRLINNKTISQQTSLRRRACTCAVVDLFVCNFESGLCGVLFDPTAQFNWTRVSGFDTSNVLYTGPISGQAGSRWYWAGSRPDWVGSRWYLLLDSRARDAGHQARSGRVYSRDVGCV